MSAHDPSPFTTALGNRRGTANHDRDPVPATPRDRAREFFAWFNTDYPPEQRLDHLRDEQQIAERLGLVLDHGQWTEHTIEPGQNEPVTLTFVLDAQTGNRIGIIETSHPTDGRLYLQDERHWSSR
jgi:hypothetical protein